MTQRRMTCTDRDISMNIKQGEWDGTRKRESIIIYGLINE